MIRARLQFSAGPEDLFWPGVLLIALVLDHFRPDSTVSHAFHRYHQRHPWLVRAMTVVTVTHLLRLLPERYDLWSLLWYLDRKLATRRVRDRMPV